MINPKEIKINGIQLSKILESHKKWIISDGGQHANLRGADLCGANLCGANLCEADLCGADLREADLCGANLCGANLCGADLRGANLCGADLREADLCGADLRGADLREAKNIEFAAALVTIVPDGDIIGWKKCKEGIVKLLIPAKAKRSNASGRKCRAEYAKDLAHFTFDGKETKNNFTSQYDSKTIYEVGKVIKPDTFDENRWEECSSGIHFFITRIEAENY